MVKIRPGGTCCGTEWLQDALENYRVPKDLVGTLNRLGEVIPERPFPVFRDEKEMGASGSL